MAATTSNRAQLRIQLIDAPLRTVTAKEVELRLEEAVGTIPNADELSYNSSLVSREREELKVMVRYPKQEREQITSIHDFRIMLPKGGQAPINEMTKISEQRTYAQIMRVNGQRAANVSADVDKQLTTPNEVLNAIMEQDIPELHNKFPGLSARIAGASEDRREDMASLAKNMLIALLIIFVMLGALLRSYIHRRTRVSGSHFFVSSCPVLHPICKINRLVA